MKKAVLIGIVFLLHPISVRADATLYLSPAEESHEAGELFTVQVLVDARSSAISSAEAELSFDRNVLAVEDVLIAGSILTSWATTPVFSNEQPKIRFAGWTKENFTGSEGVLMSIRFRALQNGVGDVRMDSAAVLAAHEIGSNVLTSMVGGRYTVEPRVTLIPYVNAVTELPEDSFELEPEVLGAASLLPPPEFTEYAGLITVGDSIRVRGLAAPNSVIAVHVMGGNDAAEVVSQIRAFDDSVFTFASLPIEEAGVYRLWAEVIEGDQKASEPSKRITITARAAGFSLFSSQSALYGAILMGILVLGMMIGLRMHSRNSH